MTDRQIRPIVKWVGGKRHLLPELLARVPSEFGHYFEPFAGGAALFFALASMGRVPMDGQIMAHLGDANEDLINLYRVVRDMPAEFVERLQKFEAEHSRALFALVRNEWNHLEGESFESKATEAAAFLYLLRSGFNGLWRINSRGEYNVGWGKHERVEFDIENLRAASEVLKWTSLTDGDYRDSSWKPPSESFVYLDPPYDETFGNYTSARKRHDVTQAEVAYHARRLDERGCYVLASNAATQRVRDLYAGWEMVEVSRRGTMSCKPSKRQRVPELLIVGPVLAARLEQERSKEAA